MSSKKKNPYRTTGRPERLNEPVMSPAPPARKYMSRRSLASQPGAVTMVGGVAMPTEEMEFGTEDDLPTNVSRNLLQQSDPEIAVKPSPREIPPSPPPRQTAPANSVTAVQPQPSSPREVPPSPPGQPAPNSVTAVLVDPDEEERKIENRLAEERKSIPMAEPVKEVPWWRQKSAIVSACVILLIIIAVSVAVPLSNRNNQAAVATESPTASPAPTALALITLVLQLDEKPWETGWELECEEGIITSAPPGTYALVTGRSNFRVEVQEVVNVGSECRFTILDTGGDGLNPGLYAIYNGNDVGDPSSLITSGSPSGPESIITFVPGSTSSASPTATPSSGGTTEPIGCTVCPDGTPVPFPDAPAEGWGSLTCSELDILASIEQNPAVCRNMQDAAAFGCGCRNFCTTMCPDRISDIDPENADDVVFIQNTEQVTCDEYQTSIETARSNSQDQCLSANFLGEDVCGCPTTGPFCRICEATAEVNRTHNPPLNGFETEIVPGVNCLDITGIAYTLKRDDPRTGFFQLCPACLSIGAYCGCDVPEEGGREFCRLCGGPQVLLPEPSRMVESSILGYNTTCYHIEFLSNIVDNSTLPCEDYRADGTEACCSASE